MRLYIFTILTLLPILLLAQSPNNPYSAKTKWESISTEFFTVYYNGQNKSAAKLVAKFAEINRYELGVLFDYRPKAKYTIFYADNPHALLHTNIQLDAAKRSPGKIPTARIESYVIHPGTTAELFQEVRKRVAYLILREFNYGAKLSNITQAELLFYNPEWFINGIADYVGYGWTYEDELWLANIQTKNIVELAVSGDDPINQTIRKSLWHYITTEYGAQKLSEIIYLVRIGRSAENGIVSVLGIQLNTLTSRWREFVAILISQNKEKRNKFREVPNLTQIPDKASQYLTGFSYNEQKKAYAIALHKNGKQKIYIYRPQEDKYTFTGIQYGISLPKAKRFRFEQPLRWNHQGSKLVTITYPKGQPTLTYFDWETKQVSSFPMTGTIKSIYDFAWSHDNQKLVVSALKNNQIDLFVTPVGEPAFRHVTKDVYDDITPSWSFDDDRIFFASNRDSLNPKVTPLPTQLHTQDFDIFAQTTDAKNPVLSSVTNSAFINETEPQMPNTFEIIYKSDASGVYNLQKYNIFLKEESYLTNITQGIHRYEINDSQIAFSTSYKGKGGIYTIPLSSLPSISTVPPQSALRVQIDTRRKIAEEERLLREKLEKEKEEMANNPVPTPPIPTPSKPEEPKAEKDSTTKKPIKYYVFDEEEEDVYEVSPSTAVVKPTVRPEIQIMNVFGESKEPTFENIKLTYQENPTTLWSVDYVGTALGFEPIGKYHLDFQVGFSDRYHNHRVEAGFRPSWNFRNSDAHFRYTFEKFQPDFFFQFNRKKRYFRVSEGFTLLEDTTIFKFENIETRVGVLFPLSSKLQAEASTGFQRLVKHDLNPLTVENRDANDNVIHSKLAFTYNNLKREEFYPYAGNQATASIDNYFSLSQSSNLFSTIRLGFSQFIPIYKRITLEASLQSAFSIGSTKQQFYMGGQDNWILGIYLGEDEPDALNQISTQLYDFQYQEFVTPMRGFRFNTRSGTKYALANFQLHIPITRILKNSLNNNSLYNLEVIPFFDAGTAWRQGNPFSQKNPTDSQIIGNTPVVVELQTLKSPFLFSFGTGIQARFLGYALRLDMAWGIDDNVLRPPQLLLSVNKSDFLYKR